MVQHEGSFHVIETTPIVRFEEDDFAGLRRRSLLKVNVGERNELGRTMSWDHEETRWAAETAPL
jgi:hypothetical protein